MMEYRYPYINLNTKLNLIIPRTSNKDNKNERNFKGHHSGDFKFF